MRSIIRSEHSRFRVPFAVLSVLLGAGCGGSSPTSSLETQRMAFYGGFNPSVVLPVVVTIDGTQVGTITGIYPGTPPGNCSADYTAKVELPKDGKNHDWNARSANGLAFSGVVRAQGSDCQRVQVF